MNTSDVSIRAALAVGFGAAAAYCWVTETPMTEYQEFLTTGVVTFYFASRTLERPAPVAGIEPQNPVDLDKENLLNRGNI